MTMPLPTNRRTFLARLTAVAAAAWALPALAQNNNDRSANQARQGTGEGRGGPRYPFSLPSLPYAKDALEPHIDAKTMELHHDKHHQSYVDNLNKALEKHPDLHSRSLEDLLSNLDGVPEDIRTAVRNHGGGHFNHTLFWDIMTPDGAKSPGEKLSEAINSAFGSLDEMKTKLNEAGTSQFGSGWAWLVVDKNGKLAITNTPNQDTPLMDGKTPILGNDVWEHAYYLKYQNKRADYLKAWWNVVNWDKVAERYSAATKS